MIALDIAVSALAVTTVAWPAAFMKVLAARPCLMPAGAPVRPAAVPAPEVPSPDGNGPERAAGPRPPAVPPDGPVPHLDAARALGVGTRDIAGLVAARVLDEMPYQGRVPQVSAASVHRVLAMRQNGEVTR